MEYAYQTLFLDIETTGLSKNRSIIYMIGCGILQGENMIIKQWFNEDAVSEEKILQDFSNYLQGLIRKSSSPFTLITFRGEQFDIPFLKCHFAYNELCDSCLDSLESWDLYKKLNPLKKAFQLEHGKQKDWEHRIGLFRQDPYDGGKLIPIYKEYLKTKDPSLKKILYLHNYEDLQGLYALSPLLLYTSLAPEDLCIQHICPTDDASHIHGLTIVCETKQCFPLPLSCANELYSMELKENKLLFTLSYLEGNLKHFYSNFKEYYYLPKEDRAIHKSVGQYVEKEYREKATAKNCYVKTSGIFFPLPLSNKKISPLQGDYTIYKTEYTDKMRYIEMDELLKQEQKHFLLLPQYLINIFQFLIYT